MSKNTTNVPNALIGQPLDRVDGRLKVTGGARYAAEFKLPGLAHACLVQSTVARGRITAIDTREAEKSPGVLACLTHLNAPRMPGAPLQQSLGDPNGRAASNRPEGGNNAAGQEQQQQAAGDPFSKTLPVLQSDRVEYYGQHVALVVAETLEQARHAADLVRITYAPERAATSLKRDRGAAYKPARLLVPLEPDTRRGDLEQGLRAAEVSVDQIYTTPCEHNQPMEMHATIAAWDGDKLTLYDSTQAVGAAQGSVAMTLQVPRENVRVVSPFLGGGFGSKFPARQHNVLAAVAARQVKRPVKLVVTRQQMFTSVGFRPESEQRVRLGAKRDGSLTAVGHEIHTQTNVTGEFVEHVGVGTAMMYATPNLLITHRAVPLNLQAPTIMRAPGESPGMFALESALDELAYSLRMDPVELRVKNDPPRDPEKNLPWSSRALVDSLRRGATAFGWERRRPEPRSMRDGRWLVGYGVASATYPTNRLPAAARVRLTANGRALVQLAATDIGTGTYTALTQIASEALGLPATQIEVQLGDSQLPPTPGSGGSWGAASYGSAVLEACLAVRGKILALVRDDARSPLRGLGEAEVEAREGRLVSRKDTSRGETYTAILRRHNAARVVEASAESKPGDEAQKFSMHAFGAQFCEVRVDEDLGVVRVSRFTGAYGAGRIINPKTARSQMVGGIIMGLGMALHEESIVDERTGHFVTRTLADYHVPVNADVPAMEIIFLDEEDRHVNPLGVKGVGEIGIVGVAAAVANAVYHATGKRIRSLPITPDKLL